MVINRSKLHYNNLRVNVLRVGFLFISFIFVIRLFFVQILNHEKYKAIAQEQHWDLQSIPPKRGSILSSDGFVLAGTQTHYLLYAEPKKIENIHEVTHTLSEILVELKLKDFEDLDEVDMPDDAELRDKFFSEYYKKIYDLLSLDLYWVVIERNITPLEKEVIEEGGIVGIGFEEEPVRYYPEESLCSHVLGFVASNESGERQGYFGIEGKLDGDLRGKPGRVVQERDALGAPILTGSYKKIDPINGRDVILTLNRSIQYIVEKRLKEGVEEYGAVSGSVVVMDPMTSDIIAMANYPTYIPSDFTKEDYKEVGVRKEIERKNLSISEVYEPGSVIKALTVSSAIDLSKVTRYTTFEDRGPVSYSDYVIDNWDGKHHGTQDIAQLLQKSNNIGAAWIAHLVGAKDLSAYFNGFGLGSVTGLDLEGEDTGIIRAYQSWADIDLATAGFGQGISATSLQVLNAFNVIANGGTLYKPKIIREIIDGDRVIEISTKKVRNVISKETSDTMTELLTQAVAGGESKFFNITNYDVAGKTGTAQIPHEGKYDPNKTNAVFVGFLPHSKKFSMIVRLDRPSTSVYASETAVPLWMGIAEELIKYYGIPPDK